MKVAKLILHYNTPELTADLCKMIGEDAIVFDNGSVPGKEYSGDNEYFRFNMNYGFVKGWNKALQLVYDRFDAFWMMNSDIQISRESIMRMQHLMDTGHYGVITPSFNCWMHQCKNHDTGRVRQVKCIEFTAPVIRKDVFEAIGFFDPVFNLGSGVDFDFALRCMKNEIFMYCDDGSSFIHLEHKSISNITTYSANANIQMNSGMTRRYGKDWKKIIYNKLNINKKETMKRVAVYTTIFGGYDHLLPVMKQIQNADFFCITDDKERLSQESGNNFERWTIIEVDQPRKDLHPRMRAKWYKVFPWEAEQLRDYEVTIFMDGCVQVNSPEFVSMCLGSLKSDIAVFKHPERNCIYDELKASEIMIKYKDENMNLQIESYRKFHPAGAGLYACTVIVRKYNQRINALMMSWMHENIKFTWQDQLSFPVVCRVHKIIPDIIPGNLNNNPYFKRIHHADKKDQDLIKQSKSEIAREEKKEFARNIPINFIIQELRYERYLEIGLRNGDTFLGIDCKLKESVDPVATGGLQPTYLMTSDRFFKENDTIYDMIFIDGDHNHDQVKKDFLNACMFLSENGCIILHDTNPVNERFTKPDRCGTAFRVLVDILYMDKMPVELYTLTIPEDEGNGISIVFKGKRTTKYPFTGQPGISLYDFNEFDKNRKEIANLIEFNELKKIVEKKAKKLFPKQK